jgi:hypothetical protein
VSSPAMSWSSNGSVWARFSRPSGIICQEIGPSAGAGATRAASRARGCDGAESPGRHSP